MGYGPNGERISRPTKALHPPKGLTPRQEKIWASEQAVRFEHGIKQGNAPAEKDITVSEYYTHFEKEVLPGKVGVSTQKRIRHDMERLLPLIGYYKLRRLNRPVICAAYEKMKKLPNQRTGEPLAEKTLAGMHACLCSVLSSAVEEEYIEKNPAWRCWKWHGECRPDCKAADEEIAKKILCALGKENLLYFVVKNGLPPWLTVHSLRHTNASLQIAQGIDVCTVASNLGHADVSTTLDIYSHAFDHSKKESQQKLEKVLGI